MRVVLDFFGTEADIKFRYIVAHTRAVHTHRYAPIPVGWACWDWGKTQGEKAKKESKPRAKGPSEASPNFMQDLFLRFGKKLLTSDSVDLSDVQ